MGGVDNICTDKTGTLTTNSMKVESLFFEEKLHDKASVEASRFPNKRALDILCESICINSNIQRKPLPNGQTELVGSKTEAALIMFSEDQGMSFEKVRDMDKVVRTIAFSSKRKKMITVFKTGASSWRVHVKGASEVILNKSTSLFSKSGDRIILDKYKKDQIMKDTIEIFAADALRTISIAYKDIAGEDPSNAPEEFLEKDLTLLAIFGIRDPLRQEIPSAIEKCKTAGITVRMVTGDNSQTAVSIAKKAGILPESYVLNEDSYVVMEGSKFTKEIGGLEEVDDPEKPGSKIKKVVNDMKFKEIIKELKVMSRSSPDDKYNLVTGLKESEHVVAVTGDGTNDAPALKKANIGFAMDSGSAVAKEAAGIILLDDNFNSIVLACKWGRNIFDSIRKFVQFQMTINVVALVLTFLGSAVLSTSPLSAVQMLWINLIMDTFAALALATEPPTDDLLERRPYGLREDIISPGMKRFIFGHTLYQLTVLMIILFEGPTIFKIPDTSTCSAYDEVCYQHFTIFFHTFVMMQIFNSINSRKLNKKDLNVFKNFCNNPLFFMIISCIFVAQIFIVEVGSSFTETSPLSITQHLICILLGSGSLLVGWLFKLIPEEVFSKIKFFKDTEVNAKTMERVTTKLRRGASSRISSKSFSHKD